MKKLIGIVLTCLVITFVMMFLTSDNPMPGRIRVPPPRPIPSVLPELPTVSMIATENTTMIIGVDGTLWGKGDNILGELGDGTTIH